MWRLAAVLALAGIVLFGASRWFGRAEPSAARVQPVSTPENSDYYMTGATVYQLSKQGTLDYRMKVERTLHFPDGSARLNDIHVHYLKDTPTYWNLEADKGRVPAGQRDLYLYGGVLIRHPRDNGDMVKIDTTHAWVRPKADRIDSDARVTAIEPGQKIVGDGMRIDLNTNKLNLLDNVHVTYTP